MPPDDIVRRRAQSDNFVERNGISMPRRIVLYAACLLMPMWVAALVLWPKSHGPVARSPEPPVFDRLDPDIGSSAAYDDDDENDCTMDDGNDEEDIEPVPLTLA
jgi:hypothetical protein